VTIGVITNESKDEGLDFTRQVCGFLRERGANPVIGPGSGEFNRAQFWVVLGGDGTMLRASRRAAVHGIPMLGINLGTLGYLTDVDKHEGLAALGKALGGEAKREQRLMLEVAAPNGGESLDDSLALNDVYLSRNTFGKLIKLDLYINGHFMDSLRADGVMVATPTGSTAYNLAAGGPILMPDGDMMVINAVCPHCLYTRPWVIAADDEVRMVTRHPAVVMLDGEQRFTLDAGAALTIRRSRLTTVILKTSDLHFYEILRRKMHH
jgi:NAD+ kinase